MPDLNYEQLALTFVASFVIVFFTLLYFQKLKAMYGDHLDEDNE